MRPARTLDAGSQLQHHTELQIDSPCDACSSDRRWPYAGEERAGEEGASCTEEADGRTDPVDGDRGRSSREALGDGSLAEEPLAGGRQPCRGESLI